MASLSDMISASLEELRKAGDTPLAALRNITRSFRGLMSRSVSSDSRVQGLAGQLVAMLNSVIKKEDQQVEEGAAHQALVLLSLLLSSADSLKLSTKVRDETVHTMMRLFAQPERVEKLPVSLLVLANNVSMCVTHAKGGKRKAAAQLVSSCTALLRRDLELQAQTRSAAYQALHALVQQHGASIPDMDSVLLSVFLKHTMTNQHDGGPDAKAARHACVQFLLLALPEMFPCDLPLDVQLSPELYITAVQQLFSNGENSLVSQLHSVVKSDHDLALMTWTTYIRILGPCLWPSSTLYPPGISGSVNADRSRVQKLCDVLLLAGDSPFEVAGDQSIGFRALIDSLLSLNKYFAWGYDLVTLKFSDVCRLAPTEDILYQGAKVWSAYVDTLMSRLDDANFEQMFEKGVCNVWSRCFRNAKVSPTIVPASCLSIMSEMLPQLPSDFVLGKVKWFLHEVVVPCAKRLSKIKDKSGEQLEGNLMQLMKSLLSVIRDTLVAPSGKMTFAKAALDHWMLFCVRGAQQLPHSLMWKVISMTEVIPVRVLCDPRISHNPSNGAQLSQSLETGFMSADGTELFNQSLELQFVRLIQLVGLCLPLGMPNREQTVLAAYGAKLKDLFASGAEDVLSLSRSVAQSLALAWPNHAKKSKYGPDHGLLLWCELGRHMALFIDEHDEFNVAAVSAVLYRPIELVSSNDGSAIAEAMMLHVCTTYDAIFDSIMKRHGNAQIDHVCSFLQDWLYRTMHNDQVSLKKLLELLVQGVSHSLLTRVDFSREPVRNVMAMIHLVLMALPLLDDADRRDYDKVVLSDLVTLLKSEGDILDQISVDFYISDALGEWFRPATPGGGGSLPEDRLALMVALNSAFFARLIRQWGSYSDASPLLEACAKLIGVNLRSFLPQVKQSVMQCYQQTFKTVVGALEMPGVLKKELATLADGDEEIYNMFGAEMLESIGITTTSPSSNPIKRQKVQDQVQEGEEDKEEEEEQKNVEEGMEQFHSQLNEMLECDSRAALLQMCGRLIQDVAAHLK